VTYDTVT